MFALPKRNTRRTTGPRGLSGVEGERQAGVLDMFFLQISKNIKINISKTVFFSYLQMYSKQAGLRGEPTAQGG